MFRHPLKPDAFHDSSIRDAINRSATSIVLSKDMSILKNLLVFWFNGHPKPDVSGPTLIRVSSTINPLIFLLVESIFRGLYF